MDYCTLLYLFIHFFDIFDRQVLAHEDNELQIYLILIAHGHRLRSQSAKSFSIMFNNGTGSHNNPCRAAYVFIVLSCDGDSVINSPDIELSTTTSSSAIMHKNGTVVS